MGLSSLGGRSRGLWAGLCEQVRGEEVWMGTGGWGAAVIEMDHRGEQGMIMCWALLAGVGAAQRVSQDCDIQQALGPGDLELGGETEDMNWMGMRMEREEEQSQP